jgi:metal-responsive CopG/Arc/MetJ family transcriptional regulator
MNKFIKGISMNNKTESKLKVARMSFMLEEDLAMSFDEFCDKKGFNKSKLIRNFISSLLVDENNVNNIKNSDKSNSNGVSFN